MTFVSFAPNHEDIMLWRGLKDVASGRYVDIGAPHPDGGSVTRAFYDRGWSGLNVTDLASVQRRLDAERLRDTTVLAVLGHQGEKLDVLLARHAPAEIHFLRIDAAGSEHAVLAGANFRTTRPWIILVRAVPPGPDQPAQSLWEPNLVDAGYVFVWFDGLNRFYVAEERAAALLPHFVVPPNLFDDFLRAADTDLATRLVRAETRAQGLADRALAAEARAREDISELMEIRVLNAHRVQQIRALEGEIGATHGRIAIEAARVQELQGWIAAIRRSTSWRLTGPMRVLIRKLRGRPEAAPMLAPVPVPLDVPRQQTRANLAARPATPAEPSAAGFPRRIVHQFHPGSARGDAITNAMLMIQRILRGLGYASEIYCAQPDPQVRPSLRPMDELPLHGDYVLLVHFSLGFTGFDVIAGLAATKVLMYHNITPPALLSRAPELQLLARLGQAQLPRWREHVVAALAVSEYNALDLRRHGFTVALSCPLLFDIDAMRAAAALPTPPRDDDVFTVLFVGRLVESKAQDDLVTAFAAFRAHFNQPCRLVLVGRAQARGDDYVDALRARVAALGLTKHVVFTGFVDDNDLRQAYRHADLYVSMSHHEGFGVPLIEAMAHDVPVLAWPSGAVAYTLGDAAELLFDRAPEAVAARMLALAEDPARRKAITRRQSRGLDRFELKHHVPRLVQTLTMAGAAPPTDPATRGLMDDNLRFTVTGHINGSYSLAGINRGLARSIEAVRPGRVRIVPVEGTVTDDLSGVPPEDRPVVATLTARPAFDTGPHVVISQHYPVHAPPDAGDAALALFFWEESVIPMETVRGLNRNFRGVLAPSSFVAKTLIDSGVSVPVHRIAQSPDLAEFRLLGEERRTRRHPGATGTMTFLHVSSCLPRKGVDILLTAFVATFRRTDAVRLVIKGYPNPHNDVPAMLADILARDPDAPEIVLINRDLDRAAFLDLYRQADVMVLPTRGEGFNLPAAEAMAARIPLIVTAYGGQSDFCDPQTARLLSSRFAPSVSHLATGDSLWVEPSMDDLVAALGEAASARTEPAATQMARRVAAAAARIDATMNDTALVDSIARAATRVLLTPPSQPVRIAWITTWNVRCGVAEYSRHLISSWPGGTETDDIVVLADDRTAPDEAGTCRVRIAWKLGAQDNVRMLSTIVAQEDPAVVVIQHQPGLLPWPALARLLRAEALAGRTLVVTLHNTLHLSEIEPDARSDVAEALQTAARLIVHTIADLEQLKALGLSANVVMLPHGVPAMERLEGGLKARALPPDSAPVLGCYGFFLPGKGISQLIEAAAELRGIWPKLRLRLVNASYGTAESEAEIQRCRRAVEAAGLSKSVDWHTTFLPEDESRALLAGCDLVVLPYQASKEASSAALRSVLAAGVPVAVTPLAVFDDAADAVARMSGTEPASIAATARSLLQNPERREALLASAERWSSDRVWPLVAERMSGVLRALAKNARLVDPPIS